MTSYIHNLFLIFVLFIGVLWRCSPVDELEKKNIDENDWLQSASIYEVNLRQYTEEGSLAAFSEHLTRLKTLGVDILWLMPIHPIGELNRKGTMGSYYSIRDYKMIDPFYGSSEEFQLFVNKCHLMGFKVILDWVANHTAWDHPWVTDHPEWYTADKDGNRPIVPLNEQGQSTDWTDVADLNYSNQQMRIAMIDAMTFWVEQFGVDGFRCDVAGFVPMDFWNEAASSLRKNNSVFLLAEWDEPKMHDTAFQMTYAWELHHVLNQLAKDEVGLSDYWSYTERDKKKYDSSAMRMTFITNHDENSWNGTVEERLGVDADALMVLAFTTKGAMPLVYSGQEGGLNKRLAFFEKDQIDWSDLSKTEIISGLLHLKEEHESLWNGNFGGDMTSLYLNDKKETMVFSRRKNKDEIIVGINLSDTDTSVSFEITDHQSYIDVFSNQAVNIDSNGINILIPAHSFTILTRA